MTNATPVKKLFWINGNSNDFGWYIAKDGSVVLERGEGDNYWSYTLAAGTILCFNDRKVDPAVDMPSAKNQNPIAMDDMADASGGAIKIDVLGNDKDPDGNTLYVNEIKTAPQKGTVEIIDNGRFVKYTPNAGATGTDTFEYFVADGRGGYDVAMVTVKLGDAGPGPGPNPTPTNTVLAGDDTASTDAGKAVVINVGANDLDPQGDKFSITNYDRTSKEGGTVSLGSDGQITYTPKAGFSGTDTFQYEVTDAKGAKDTATVTITVAAAPQPTNRNPDAADDNATTDAGKVVTVDVLKNDTDADGDKPTIAFVSNGSNGTTRIVNGQIEYTPRAGFSGTDSFTYVISDGKGGFDQATVSVTVKDGTPVPTPNTAPDAVNDTSMTDQDKPVTINVTGNDTDKENDKLTVTFVSNGSNGTTQIVNNQVVYTPRAGFSGTDSFTYVISDGKGGFDQATVSVTIKGTTPPQPVNTVDAVNDSATAEAGKSTLINVLSNDKDDQGDKFSLTSFTQGAKGTVARDAAGNLIYTANAGATGTDTFTYTIIDENGATDTATVTVTIKDAPVVNTTDAVDDCASTDAGKSVSINVLSNDVDAQKDGQFIISFTNGTKGGTVTQGANGQLIYVPAAGFSGTDTFTYTIIDSKGATDTATVTVDVKAAPVVNTVDAVNDTATAKVGQSTTINVRANDKDDQGDSFTVTSFGQGGKGSVVLDGQGNLVYTPNAGASGTDTFTYTITDSKGATDTATVKVTLEGNFVFAGDDKASTDFGKPVTIRVGDNDQDPEGDSFSIVNFTQPANGTVTKNADGTFTYTPRDGFSGTDTFIYQVEDVKGAGDTATVAVTVGGKPNTAPNAVDDSKSTDFGKAVTFNALSNDTDPENDTLSIDSFTQPTNGSVTKNADGTFTYTPKAGFSGQDSYTYTISDGNGGFDTATVVVTVGAKPNTKPVAVGDNATVGCGQNGVVVEVLSNDDDADGDTLEVVSVTQGSKGSVEINADGTVSYQPKPGFYGTDNFTYTIADGNGGSATATVTVNIEEPRKIWANVVGDKTVNEGSTGSYKVQLDEAVSEDTWITLQVSDGTAQRVDRNDNAANHQDFAWGGYVNYFDKYGKEIKLDNKVWNGQYVSDGYRDAVGPDGTDSWDYTVLKDGVVQQGGEIRVLVKAGETVSESFSVKAFTEKVLIDNDAFGGVGAHEGTESFKVAITKVESDDCDVIMTGDAVIDGQIVDKTCYVSVSPVAIDMNRDGSINVTGVTTSFNKDPNAVVGKTVDFDMNGDGTAEKIEWLDGSGDGLLVDMSKIGADGSINGKALFGDDTGTFNNGYEKLSLLDANGDAKLAGDELAKIGVWVDDGDAVLEAGEMKSANDFGIASVSTDMEIVMGKDGLEQMQSSATMADGSTLLTEDVWFANDNGGDDQAQADLDASMLQHQANDPSCQ